MVSPGRKGVGWETISLIEGKRLKRGFQAVDQRHTHREEEKRFHNLIFLIKLGNSEKLKVLGGFKEIIRLNKGAFLAFPRYYNDCPAIDFI